jgi:hypothetical protein
MELRKSRSFPTISILFKISPKFPEMVEKYLDYSNPKNGFARIWCSEYGTERFLP